ncbi:glutamyl-tRNA reductase [Bernardetia litoralis DSM 6794]|uniref:Glutamyl-tRNA reductase n=1 Tax=Bernardetia litoralis (strain ATCC 23117 / DSM 6794 / NBRC 15988 / NCIMB 1366 / Fx l1 / Sio-4) TaxID=880071 RepID=I4AGL9_BERLS|nr:glutamyl-tRNA reductase [Bernardetia litoralis]AFM03104.1 glutamyl-tRNA reductase [Bernardetia litoralis DSM 6794]
MENSFHTFYISHKEADVPTREYFSLSERETETLLLSLQQSECITEVFVISTCNRTEIYWYGNENSFKIVKEKFAQLKAISTKELIETGFKYIDNSEQVIKRFFEISVGVDSQIVGDWQITYQIKQAYQLADELGTIGTYFHKLISYVLQASKKITTQTVFRSGAASVSFATADLVRQLSQQNENKKNEILVVGVGKIGSDTVRNLRKMGIKNVKITNRTIGKSAMLATENAYEIVDFEHVFQEAQKADIIISSISKPNFFNTTNIDVQKICPNQHFIDLSMPRSIESVFSDFVTIYNIDDLKEQTKAVREERIAALPLVHQIIKNGIDDFEKWKDEYQYVILLQPFKKALEDLKSNISNKYSSELNDKNRELMMQMLTDFTQKAMRIPVVNLKNHLNNTSTTDSQKPFLDTIQQLFS